MTEKYVSHFTKHEDYPLLIDEIKYEFDIDTVQCFTCLSIGRKLNQLKELTGLFQLVTSGCLFKYEVPIETIQICWECRHVLKKLELFQKQVKYATELIQTGQSYIHGPLSNLTSITQSDLNNIVYVQEPNTVDTDKKEVLNKPKNQDILANNVKISQKQDEFSNVPSIKTPSIDNRKKLTIKSKWAIKRKLQNKKPKFKIVATNFDNVFKRIIVDNEEVKKVMKRDAESEIFQLNKFKCNKCVLGFKKLNSWKKHCDIHLLNSNYKCDICKINSKSKTKLKNHIKSHYYIYKCNICLSVCRKGQTNSHMRKHKTIFQCNKCMVKYGNRREFFKHYKENHEQYICNYCGITFKMKYCIKNHIKKQHSPHVCKFCGKKFASYNGLWVHNRTTHRPVPTYYSKNHTNRPRKSYRIPCPECKKIFSKNIYMKDHYNLVHLKLIKYRCDPCYKNFIRNAELVKHKRKIHEGIMPEKNKICYVCGRGFSTNNILYNHIRTHTGERPYSCRHCDAQFTQNSSLKSHCKTKHGNM